LTEEEQREVISEEIRIPTESVNRNTQEDMQADHQEGQQEGQQKAILLEEDDTHHEDRYQRDIPQGVHAPITPEPNERGHLPVIQDPPNDTLPSSFPTEELPELPPSPPEEQNTTEFSPAATQGVDPQTTTQTEQQNVCEEEDQPTEPNPPHEGLTEEDHPDTLSDSEQQLHAELHTRRNNGIDAANIIEGSRRRRPRVDPDFHTYATVPIEDDPPELLRTFAAALYTEKPLQRHRDDLPPVPDS
jgi:hypothetical protein